MNSGIHLLIDAQNCALPALSDVQGFMHLMRTRCADLGLEVVGQTEHVFAPYSGFTATLLLAASHIAVHTWPEHGEVSADVYLCHHSHNHTATAHAIAESLLQCFGAKQHRIEVVQRGQTQTIKEQLSVHTFLNLHEAKLLHQSHTGLQHIAFYEHPDFGRLFTLDGVAMSSEKDEAAYHEAMLAHMPDLPDGPGRVLIIGGGDGAAARRALAKGAEKVVVCELDERVVRLCQEYLPSLSAGVWQDARCELIVGDALGTVPNLAGPFDAIVLDLTDPGEVSLANQLYAREFLSVLKAKLSARGYLAMHLGSPFYQAERCAALYARVQTVFTQTKRHTVGVPLYGGLWDFAYGLN